MHHARRGFTLTEILAVVTIIGIVAAIIVPRFTGNAHQAKRNACAVNRGFVEVQAQLWYRNKGSWPNADLSDARYDGEYFPDGIPVCPVDNSAYRIDGTGHVQGHQH